MCAPRSSNRCPRPGGRVARGGGVRARGITLVELLVAVAVIGIIAAVLIPNLLISVDKAKQKRTMAEMQKIGEAMTAYYLDEVGAAAAGASSQFDLSEYGPVIDVEELEARLVPIYVPVVPQRDQWGFDLEYYLNSLNLNGDDVIAVRSAGKDGQFASSYVFGPFFTTDFTEDLVWADGRFVRWPNS